MNIFKVIMKRGKKNVMQQAKQVATQISTVEFNRIAVDKIFLEICNEIIIEDGKINSQQGFNYLSRRLADYFPVEASTVDLVKKYFHILNLWMVWKRLIKKPKGIQIDFNTGKIVADESWWTRKLQEHPNVTNTINYIRFNGLHYAIVVRNIFEDYKTSEPTSCSSVSTGYIPSSAVKLLDKFPELEVDSTLYRFSLNFLRDLDNRKFFQAIWPTHQLRFLKNELQRMECFNSNTIHRVRNIPQNGFPNHLTKKIFKHNKIRKQIPLEGAGDSSWDPEFQDPHLVGYALRSVKNKGLAVPPKPMKKKGGKRIVTSLTNAKNRKKKDVRAISSVQSSCR